MTLDDAALARARETKELKMTRDALAWVIELLRPYELGQQLRDDLTNLFVSALRAYGDERAAEQRERIMKIIWGWRDRLGGFEAEQLIAAIRAQEGKA